MRQQTYTAHVVYEWPLGQRTKAGFRSLVAAVHWIERQRLGVRCYVLNQRGVVYYERP